MTSTRGPSPRATTPSPPTCSSTLSTREIQAICSAGCARSWMPCMGPARAGCRDFSTAVDVPLRPLAGGESHHLPGHLVHGGRRRNHCRLWPRRLHPLLPLSPPVGVIDPQAHAADQLVDEPHAPTHGINLLLTRAPVSSGIGAGCRVPALLPGKVGCSPVPKAMPGSSQGPAAD